MQSADDLDLGSIMVALAQREHMEAPPAPLEVRIARIDAMLREAFGGDYDRVMAEEECP